MEDSKLLLEEIDASDLAKRIKRRAENAKNEEELRIGFAIELDDILKKWNIRPFYERKAEGFRAFVSGARKDALYGTVVLEFKSPGKFKSMKEYKKAVEQVKRYIEEEAGEPRYYSRYFGVLTDGFRIGFMRYRKGNWEVTGRLDINSQTIFRLLEAIRGLKRKPLEARYILEVFGPTTDISKRSILTLYNTIVNPHSSRTQMLFEDWKRVFSQVCAYSTEKLKGLTKYYNLEEDIDVEKLMFAIHTYYTILMKLMTS